MYTIAAWSRTQSHGTPNSIIARAATLKDCLSEYRRHLARFTAASISPNYAAVILYKNGKFVKKLA